MLKERHANLVVTKVAEKLEAIRKQQNSDALKKLKSDPRLKQLKKLFETEERATAKRRKLYDEISEGMNGIAWLSDGGKIDARRISTYPSKSELSVIKMDVVLQIIRGKITDVDALIDKIVSERSKQ